MSNFLEWSNEQSLRLIEEYERKQELWDNQHDNYRVQSAKYAAWAELAELFDCHPMDVKRKMNSLLSSHRRERCRVAHGRSSQWYAYDALSFIADKFPMKDFEADLDFEPNEETSEEQADDTELFVAIKNERTLKPPHKKLKTTLKPHKAVEKKKRDPCNAFGDYVAHSLRQHDDKTKSIIKHAINNILFEAEMKKYNTSFDQLFENDEEINSESHENNCMINLQPETQRPAKLLNQMD